MNAAGEMPERAVLVAPLDWGLGHASRCIPIIEALLRNNCRVLVAAEGSIKTLLLQEFPQVTFLDLKGYRIRYAANGWATAAQIVGSIPRILATIAYEQQWLQEVILQHRINAVISDNRYGLHHPSLPSVFITHQLQICSPFGKASERLLQELNYHYINRFSACWVPDFEHAPGLAGSLSHPPRLPRVPVRYIGPLSRFPNRGSNNTGKGSLLIMISGPEPQRSLFEAQCLRDLKHYKGLVTLLRGLPGSSTTIDVGSNVMVFNHLNRAALNKVLQVASFVVARCGYSTVMDLAALGKRGLLVPTPGQTEQVYLARHLQEQQWALTCRQSAFKLAPLMELADNFPYRAFPAHPKDDLNHIIEDFLRKI